MEHDVTFLGKQDHVERLFPQAKVLLMPSDHEAFGLAALEGMACGVVPVATQVGGVAELITAGVDGFLEPVGDVESQAGRVIQLLTSDSLFTRMSEAARTTAVTCFDTSAIIPRYEALYAQVLQGDQTKSH